MSTRNIVERIRALDPEGALDEFTIFRRSLATKHHTAGFLVGCVVSLLVVLIG